MHKTPFLGARRSPERLPLVLPRDEINRFSGLSTVKDVLTWYTPEEEKALDAGAWGWNVAGYLRTQTAAGRVDAVATASGLDGQKPLQEREEKSPLRHVRLLAGGRT